MCKDEFIKQFSKRLNKAMGDQDIAYVVNRIQIGEVRLSSYLSGYKYQPILLTDVIKLAELLNVNFSWLAVGNGPMRKKGGANNE